MHITIGRPRSDRERELIAGGRDFALQVVREGYVATVIEQGCLGERKCERVEIKCSPEDRSPACHLAAMTATRIPILNEAYLRMAFLLHNRLLYSSDVLP